MPNIAFLSTAQIHTKGFLESIVKATDGRKACAILDYPAVDGVVICAENTRHLPLLK